MNQKLLVISVLALGGCSNSFKADGLDLPTDTLSNAFVESKTYTADLDGDGTDDFTLEGLGIVITDRADYCAAVTSEGAPAMSDVFAVQILALGDDMEFGVETNAALLEILLDPQAGDGFVGMLVTYREGGSDVAQLASRNLVDGAARDRSSIDISSRAMSNGSVTSLTATFEGTLGADFSDPTAYDTDVNGDDVPDFASMSEDVKGRAYGAKKCDSLYVLP